jgi:hypothetical protein
MAYNFVQANSSRIIVTVPPVTALPATLSAWIRPDATATGNRSIVVLSGSDELVLRIGSNNKVQARLVFNNGSDILTISTVGTVTAGAWTHAAARVGLSGSMVQVVANIDGAINDGGQGSYTQAAFLAGQIGSFGGTNTFGGDIADVGIWNTALSDAEIVSLSKGITCNKVRPQSLRFYAPLTRNLVDIKGSRALSAIGSPTVSNHPRIYT